MKIAVVGAGISGLTFAAALQRFSPSVEVEVYERDQSLTSRPQGYSLGLNGDMGLSVLKTLGLYEHFSQDEKATITHFVFSTQHGQRLLELPTTSDEEHLRQRVQRQALRVVLGQAVQQTSLNFDRHCTGYQQSEEGVEVSFEDGTKVQADYLVACDGVSSVLRQQLSGDQKRYLGLTSIIGEMPGLIKHPLLQGGYFMTLGDDGTSLFCYRQPESVHLSYVVRAPSEADLAEQAPAELLDRLQLATKSWHAPIPELVAAIDPATIKVRGYYDKEPLRQVYEGRLWLVGDAAHPMAPFQGLGANLGMLDALELAQYFGQLVSLPDQDGKRARALEAKIVARGRKAVMESRAAARRFHLTSRQQQRWRNVSFRIGNLFISGFSHRQAISEQAG